MNQLYTTVALTGAIFLFLGACQFQDKCPEITGHFTNREGQDLVFQPGGKALWLVRFGSTYDTSKMQYQLDCKQNPISLNLNAFEQGPFVNKTLLGIIEWSSDTSFRFRYEAGTDDTERPHLFDGESTQEYFLVR
jgi:hypothetical protein